MKHPVAISFVVVSLLMMAPTSRADVVKGFTSHWYEDQETGLNLPFRLFTPLGYEEEPDRQYPLILFLHGAGESGTNNTSQINANIDNLLAHAKRDQYAAFILAPQTDSGWLTYGDEYSEATGATMSVVDLLVEYYRIDPRRLYVTGLSMGGGGTWDVIGKRPNFFAAAIPICGYGDTSQAVNMVNQPIWAFHAANDGTVSVEYTREMIAAVRDAGGDPLYTEYTSGGHGIWGQVYAADAHYNWMFSQVLPTGGPPVAEVNYYYLDEDGTLAVEPAYGVLSDDADPDGDPLTAVRYSFSQPEHGALSLRDDGSFEYTPEENFFGTDAFGYQAFDGVLYSPVTTVYLEVASVNDAPVAMADSYEIDESGRVIDASEGVLANDLDVETPEGLLAVLDSDVSHGVLWLDDVGSFRYVPDEDYYGRDSFTYLAFDGEDYSEPTSVLIRVASSVKIPGDANGDGRITGADAAIVAAHWLDTVGDGVYDGDFNGDTVVDDLDLAILAANWPSPGNGAVPEPATTCLLVIGLLTTLCGRTWAKRSGRLGRAWRLPRRAPGVASARSRAKRPARSAARSLGDHGGHRLRVEPLEDRRMLTIYLVDSLDDTVLDDGLTTLREAMTAADGNAALWDGAIPAGSDVDVDTIQFDPTLFTDGANPAPGIITLALDRGALSINDPAGLDIQGPGAELLSIDAQHASQILVVNYGARGSLSDLALVNGSADSGGGVQNSGTLSIVRATISGNSATNPEYAYGGAIRNFGDLSIANSTISDNRTLGSYGIGGAIYNGGTLTIADSTISDNATANSYYGIGGAIYNYGEISIAGSTLSGNSTDCTEYGIGGAIYSYGALSITGSTITDNASAGGFIAYGGAIYSGGTLSIGNSTISRNSAAADEYYAYGGGIYNDGEFQLAGSTILDNVATGRYYAYGGGVYSSGNFSLAGSTISGNSVTSTGADDYDEYGAYGGGVCSNGTLAVVDSTVAGNLATSSSNAYGGGVYSDGAFSVLGSLFLENSATASFQARGGGIHNVGTLDLDQSTVSGNSATSSSHYAFGGGVCNEGTLAIVESTVSNNTLAISGGGVQCGGAGICNADGETTLNGSVVSGNTTTGTASHGGGIGNINGTTTVSDSLVANNSTSGVSSYGGGIYVLAGTVTVARSTLSENHGYLGGAAYSEGTLIVSHSTIAGNLANAAGGLCNYGDLTVASSTVSGNSTTTGVGGGIVTAFRNLPSKLSVVNSTISGNSATSGSGVFASGGKSAASIVNSTITANSTTTANGAIHVASSATVLLHNTVVAGNAGGNGAQIFGNVSASSSHNVIGTSTGLSGVADGVNGNQIGAADAPIDPMLGPLADNGGPTWTHAPLPGSPVIDAGDDVLAIDAQGASLRVDQRGYLRRFGPVDVGAVEDQPPGVPVAYGDGFAVNQDASAVLDVLVNDFCSGGCSMVVQLVGAPSHGTLQSNPDGTLTYTPDAAFWGVDTFSYRAVNEPWASDVVDVVISVISSTSIVVTTAEDGIDGDLSPEDVSLREALEMASPGAVIQFSAGLMDQVIRLNAADGPLAASDVQIVGLGAEHLTIDGGGRCRVFEVDGASLIAHLSITGGLNSGVYVASDATLTVDNCVISGNVSFGGSGIFNNGGTVAVVDSRVANNAVTSYAFTGGGGILNRGDMTITRSVISQNSARTATTGADPGNRGGGILNEGTLAIVDSTISYNDAGYTGGGIANVGGSLTVVGCDFQSNSADYLGGALDNNSDRGADVSDSSFSGNVAGTTGGGAIAVSAGEVTLTRSVLDGNLVTGASACGGAIYCVAGSLTVVQSTISGNTAVQFGGGIFAAASGVAVTVRNSTIAGNVASRGGGLANVSGAVVANSILALNQAASDADFFGTLHASSGYNLIGEDPLFARNPGPGDGRGDLRLRRGSPAINAGGNALALDAQGDPLTTDLDALPRFVSGVVDLGPYEFQSALFVVDSLEDAVADDGFLTLREALQAANANASLWDGDVPAGSAIATDIITFDPALFTDGVALVPGRITLGGAQLEILDDVRIEGPGAELLAIDANAQSRAFFVGAGLEASLSDLTVTGGRVVDSDGGDDVAFLGGGVFNLGALTLSGLSVSGNSANAGGGIYSGQGSLTVVHSTLSGNSCQLGGGGLLADDGAAIVSDSTFSGNSANSGGAVLVRGGNAELHQCVIVGNSAVQSGGAIFVQGDSALSVANSTIVGNSANSGGGLHAAGGAATITNSIVAGNFAEANGGGLLATAGALTLTNATVAANVAGDEGGGVHVAGGTLVAANTILALNQAPSGADLRGIIGPGGGAVLLGANPGFLRNPSPGGDGAWGTPDDDYGNLRLRSDSLALNAGANALAVDAQGNPLETDRDGNPRILYGAVDLGAYECPLAADANIDGVVDRLDAAILAAHWLMCAGATWADADFNGDGCVDDLDAAILAANWQARVSQPAPEALAEPPLEPGSRFIGPRQLSSQGAAARRLEPLRLGPSQSVADQVVAAANAIENREAPSAVSRHQIIDELFSTAKWDPKLPRVSDPGPIETAELAVSRLLLSCDDAVPQRRGRERVPRSVWRDREGSLADVISTT
ncbi:MAG: tandem-95 repeat protein [Pirellulales bacterium]|nr:tandem-95 repeat protein [Pirellulales bacterium]